MVNKRPKGVIIFASLYLCGATPFLFPILLILFGFFQIVFFPNQTQTHVGNPLGLIPLVLFNILLPILPLYLMIRLSMGLFQLSNYIRLQMLTCNKIFLGIFLIAIIYVFMLPIIPNYKILAIGVLGGLSILVSASIYYFTRPKVMEYFK